MRQRLQMARPNSVVSSNHPGHSEEKSSSSRQAGRVQQLGALHFLAGTGSEEVLETEAAECYNRIDSPELDRASVAGMQEAYVSWLMQLLPYKGAKEIE